MGKPPYGRVSFSSLHRLTNQILAAGESNIYVRPHPTSPRVVEDLPTFVGAVYGSTANVVPAHHIS